MGCRIGMATDVAARVSELWAEEKVPEHAEYEILNTGLTYDDANFEEGWRRAECGDHCEGHSGGEYVPGLVWSVYRIDW